MIQHTINFPNCLTLKECIGLAKELLNLPEADEYILNFEKLNNIEPFGMLFLSSEIQRCMASHDANQFHILN